MPTVCAWPFRTMARASTWVTIAAWACWEFRSAWRVSGEPCWWNRRKAKARCWRSRCRLPGNGNNGTHGTHGKYNSHGSHTSIIPMKPLRILLADDHTVLRQGLRLLLERHPEFQVIGEASDGHQAIEMAEAGHPDVVILDLGMPRLNGIEAARQITAKLPSTAIVIL